MSGIVYLHRILETRMTTASMRDLRMFKKLLRNDERSKNAARDRGRSTIAPGNRSSVDRVRAKTEATVERHGSHGWATRLRAPSPAHEDEVETRTEIAGQPGGDHKTSGESRAATRQISAGG